MGTFQHAFFSIFHYVNMFIMTPSLWKNNIVFFFIMVDMFFITKVCKLSHSETSIMKNKSLLTAYQNIWHAWVSFYFSVKKDELLVFPERNAYFPTPSPYSILKTSRRFFQSGKISGVLKIDAYMVRRSKIWSLHRSMHHFTSTLNRGEGVKNVIS